MKGVKRSRNSCSTGVGIGSNKQGLACELTMMRCASSFVSGRKDANDAVAEADEIGIDVTTVLDRISSTLRSKKSKFIDSVVGGTCEVLIATK